MLRRSQGNYLIPEWPSDSGRAGCLISFHFSVIPYTHTTSPCVTTSSHFFCSLHLKDEKSKVHKFWRGRGSFQQDGRNKMDKGEGNGMRETDNKPRVFKTSLMAIRGRESGDITLWCHSGVTAASSVTMRCWMRVRLVFWQEAAAAEMNGRRSHAWTTAVDITTS